MKRGGWGVEQRWVKRVVEHADRQLVCCFLIPSPFTFHSFLPSSLLPSPSTPSFCPPPFTLSLLFVPSFPSPSTSPGKWKDYPVGITGYSYLFGSVYMGLGCLYFVMVGRSQEFKLPSKVSLVTSVYYTRPSPTLLASFRDW